MEYDEEFDKLKTKVLKYIMYKKRTEQEVRQKFSGLENTDLVDKVIEQLKELEYISDNTYIEKAVNEFMRLKNMSIKEIKYKLMTKGLKNNLIDSYIQANKEELVEYEFNSAKNIITKRRGLIPDEEITTYLNKKGYISDIIKGAFNE